MKANQKFKEADEAVSPVIGVILMVAITVVLAAVVFVLVSDLGGGGESQPAISWQVSQADGTATVTAADAGTTWDEYEFRCSAACQLVLNSQTLTQDASSTYTQITGAGNVGGGDVLTFCQTAASSGSVDITLRHIDSNSVAREFSFNNLDGTC